MTDSDPNAPLGELLPADEPAATADLDRRRFFRQFATDIVHTAATVVGAATALQRGTAEAASTILGGGRAVDEPPDAEADPAAWPHDVPELPAGTVAGDGGQAAPPAPAVAHGGPAPSTFGRPRPAVGYHSAFRVEGERIVLINQRRLPFAIVEVDCRTAIEVASEIRDRTMVGGPAIAQAAALGLACSANRIRASRPYARRAILRAAETTVLQARPTSRQLRAATERVMGRYLAIGELGEDGDAIADAMANEANAIIFEANDDHGRIAEAAATMTPRQADRPTGILTLGATGAMAGGQSGLALGAIQAAVYAESDVHVYVLEGRPALDGARVTAWELAQAGITHTLLPDPAAGWILASGSVDVVLVGAEAIAANGDVTNDAGTYAVAALARRHGIPVVVCAPLASVDPAAADGFALITEERAGRDILQHGPARISLPDTPALSPIVDLTPADLVTAWATEEGLLVAPFGDAWQAAVARRMLRLGRAMGPGAGHIPASHPVPAAGGGRG